MKVSLLSDLHIEAHEYNHNIPESDVLVLAGDICDGFRDSNKNYKLFMASVKEKFGNNVIQIHGNHEGYHNNTESVEDNRGIKIIDNVCFIYATLWSGHGSEYAYTRISDAFAIEGFSYSWMSDQHRKDVKHITDSLLKYSKQYTTVVVTHHLPHINCVASKYKANDALLNNKFLNINLAFYTDLDDIIKNLCPDYWFCGHTHISYDSKIHNTRCVINPRGYPFEPTNFNPNLVINI